MYPLISTWTIVSGKKDEAISVLKKLALKVEKEESDTWMYTVHVPDFEQKNLPTPPVGQVIFYEVYKDEAAFKSHVSGKIFTDFVHQYKDLFLCNEGKPYVTLLVMDRKAGFIRSNLK